MATRLLTADDFDKAVEISKLRNRNAGTTAIHENAEITLIAALLSNDPRIKVFGYFEDELISFVAVKFGELGDEKVWVPLYAFTSRFTTYFNWERQDVKELAKMIFTVTEQYGYLSYVYAISSKLERVIVPPSRYEKKVIRTVEGGTQAPDNWVKRMIGGIKPDAISIVRTTLKQEFRPKNNTMIVAKKETGGDYLRGYPDAMFRSGLAANLFPESPNFEEARTLARKLSGEAFNLEEFPYIYFTSGASEALDFLLSKTQHQVLRGEYRYVFGHDVTVEERDHALLSYPFSATGRFENLDKMEGKKLILDSTYMFASNMNCPKDLPSNVEQIIFSVGKSHNVADMGCGWFFSKTKFSTFHTRQYELNYGMAMHVKVLRNVAKYPANHLYKKYQEKFSAKYQEAGLTEVDTNLFALDDNGTRVYWQTL